MKEPLGEDVLRRILGFQSELGLSEPDISVLMDLTVKRVMELTGSSGAAIELFDGTDIVYRAVSGIAGGQLGLRLSKEGSFSGLCVAVNSALLCRDSETDSRVNREACRVVGLRSMVVHPLVYRERPVGVLKVMSPDIDGVGEKEREILCLIAPHVAGTFENASRWAALKERNETLDYLASHDVLTGLKNRSAFYDGLRQGLALGRRTGFGLATVLLDLDGLKAANDTHGHQAGDALITAVGSRLSGSVREIDTAARLGGDEFGVLFPLLKEPASASSMAEKLAERVEGPLKHGDVELNVRLSYGVSVWDSDGTDVETLIAKADERLYAHKKSRKAGRS